MTLVTILLFNLQLYFIDSEHRIQRLLAYLQSYTVNARISYHLRRSLILTSGHCLFSSNPLVFVPPLPDTLLLGI